MRTSSSPASSRGASPFTVAWVPTGMNTGVSTMPCGVCSKPARARVTGHSACISKGNLLADNLFQPGQTITEVGELRQELALVLLHRGPDDTELRLHRVIHILHDIAGQDDNQAQHRTGRDGDERLLVHMPLASSLQDSAVPWAQGVQSKASAALKPRRAAACTTVLSRTAVLRLIKFPRRV